MANTVQSEWQHHMKYNATNIHTGECRPLRMGSSTPREVQWMRCRCIYSIPVCALVSQGTQMHSRTDVQTLQISGVHMISYQDPFAGCHFVQCLPESGIDYIQNQVHDSKCCKWFFFCPLEREKSYPPKLNCITPNVANSFSHAH